MIILRPIFLTAIILSLTASIAADASPSAADPPSASDFIRTSCDSTQYPDVCYGSLSSYASSVQHDPARLAMAAIGVSLSRATRMSVYLANLTRRSDIAASAAAADPRAAAALRDCTSVFGDAVEQMRGSMKQMRRLSAFAEELRFQMSNVQTWMSAALTNEETCTDGFEEVADGPVKADVCDRTVGVKEVTSNALALVNNYAANCQG